MKMRPWRWPEDLGATAVEYALMVSLIALAIVGGVAPTGLSLAEIFNSIPDVWGIG